MFIFTMNLRKNFNVVAKSAEDARLLSLLYLMELLDEGWFNAEDFEVIQSVNIDTYQEEHDGTENV